MPSMKPRGNSFRGHSGASGARFDAHLDALPAATEFVAAALRQAGIPQDRIARCELVLEELFRNSVLHGYGAMGKGSIWIGIDEGDAQDGICLWYEDEAPPFDPLTADLPDGGAVRPVEQQRIGGVGLQLIRQLPGRVAYCRQDGRNRITFVP